MDKSDDRKSILLISGGEEALPIIEAARAMGLRTVVSDGSRQAPGFAIADEAILASTYDSELTTRLAVESNKNRKIDGVIAAAADVPVTVSAVASALGLVGPTQECAILASDKLAMKDRFRKSGVPVPWYSALHNFLELEEYLEQPGKSFVIKPVDSRGARGVIRIVPGTDPEWAFNEAVVNSPSGRVMIEEWVEGRQISTESIVTGRGLVTPGLSDRNYRYLERFAPFVIEDGGDLPALLSAQEKEKVDRVLGTVASAFGLVKGTLKGDIVMAGTGPVVIEAAVRLSGGYFSSHTILLSSGVNIVEAAIRIALGEELDPGDYVPTRATNVCQRFLFPAPGRVVRVDVDETAYDDPACELLKVYQKPGDIVEEVKSHPCRSGMVITTGADREEAQRAASAILEKVKITVEDDLHTEV